MDPSVYDMCVYGTRLPIQRAESVMDMVPPNSNRTESDMIIPPLVFGDKMTRKYACIIHAVLRRHIYLRELVHNSAIRLKACEFPLAGNLLLLFGPFTFPCFVAGIGGVGIGRSPCSVHIKSYR